MSYERTVKATFRLPASLYEASDSWDDFREHLTAWTKAGGKLPTPRRDPLKLCGMVLPEKVMTALEKEAERLTEATGEKWTTARVARQVWETWAPK